MPRSFCAAKNALTPPKRGFLPQAPALSQKKRRRRLMPVQAETIRQEPTSIQPPRNAPTQAKRSEKGPGRVVRCAIERLMGGRAAFLRECCPLFLVRTQRSPAPHRTRPRSHLPYHFEIGRVGRPPPPSFGHLPRRDGGGQTAQVVQTGTAGPRSVAVSRGPKPSAGGHARHRAAVADGAATTNPPEVVRARTSGRYINSAVAAGRA